MTVLVTGAAGFIGMHVAQALLARGEKVVGIDNMNDYYDPKLKQARLKMLEAHPGFAFFELDLANTEAFNKNLAGVTGVKSVINLAAQAGVRYSLENPFAYANSNLLGFLTVLEYCRNLPTLEHLVFASSSSVYGGNTKLPFAVGDKVDSPVSLYAATKKSNELMGHSYSHLYDIPMTGLRFFTVYGPWGRPDMAYWSFSDAILEGRPIRIFNNGDMKRDFTYIDDIVSGVVAVLDHPPKLVEKTLAPYRVYNIGNNRSEPLMKFIDTLEAALGVEAIREFAPMQPGDVKETYADIDDIMHDTGYKPATNLDVGLPIFAEWFKHYKQGKV
jgi:UDP-glucuronate 4-epimerase